MSLSAALAANRKTLKGPICTVCTLVANLSPEDAKALQEAFDDFGFTSAAIARALKAEGHDISPNTVVRHRKRECRG
jgi:hypothetical protein